MQLIRRLFWFRVWLRLNAVRWKLLAASLVVFFSAVATAVEGDEVSDKAEERPKFLDLTASLARTAVWRTRVGTYSSTPVVAQGRVLLGTNNKRPRNPKITGDRGVLMCFDASDGSFLWQHTHAKLQRRIQDTPGMGIRSEPVVVGNRVFYTSNRGELVCLDLDGFRDRENDGPFEDERDIGIYAGDVCWTLDAQETLGVFRRELSDNPSAVSSPLVFGDTVYWNTGNGSTRYAGRPRVPRHDAPSIIAVDVTSGEIKWQSNLPGKGIQLAQWADPVIADIGGRRQLVFGAGDGAIYSYDAKSGALFWKLELSEDIVRNSDKRRDTIFEAHDFFVASPVVGNERIIFSLGHGRGELTPHFRQVFAIDTSQAMRGKEVVTWTYGPNAQFSNGTLGEIVVSEGRLFTLSSSGFLIALNEASGRELWIADLGSVAADLGEPVLGRNRVYAATESDLYSFDLSSQKQLLSHWDLSGSFLHTAVAESHDRVYVVTSEHLWAIDIGSH